MHLNACRQNHCDRERGSALVLVPAGFLVLMALAALAVDSAVAYLGQQQLHDALVAAANDAASASIDNSQFYRSGAVVISQPDARRVVCQSLAAQGISQLHDLRVWMAVRDRAVRLEGSATVKAVFGGAIPGFGTRHVRANVQAVVITGTTSPQAAGRGTATSPAPADSDLVRLDCG